MVAAHALLFEPNDVITAGDDASEYSFYGMDYIPIRSDF